MTLADQLAILLLALAVEAAVGYPDRLYRRVGHPVTWMGRLIAALDRVLNWERWPASRRQEAGVVALVVLLAAVWLAAGFLSGVLSPFGIAGAVGIGLLASTMLAQRSLHRHVKAVATALRSGGLEAGREAVARIVGRNPKTLDEAAVCRAAIESLAENFSDGVVAPAFWIAIGGLPGGALYKAVNTADSMIGHRTPRHEAFGWAAARLDDLVNLPASRLSAVLIVAAAGLMRGASPSAAWKAVQRDAGRHRSPNAGWPEAAVASALGLRLAGPRVYGLLPVPDAWMGEGRGEATPDDVVRALALYRRACLLLWLLVAALTALLLP